MKLLYSSLFILLAVHLSAAPSFDDVAQVIKDGNRKELRKILKDYPDSVSLVSDYGHTPLFIACGWYTIDMVKILIENGSDIHVVAENGSKPIDLALVNFYKESYEQRDKIMAYLKNNGSGKAKNEDLILEYSNRRPMNERPDIGPEPEQSELDSSVKIVKKYILKTAYQPDRIKFLEWSAVIKMYDKWAVRVKYRGRSLIGLEVVSNQWYYIRNAEVVGSKDIY